VPLLEESRVHCGVFVIVVGVLVCASAGGAEREVIEQVAAEVNGERIMLSEVLGELREDLAALPADPSAEARRRRKDALIRARLLEIIRRRLILQEADGDLSDVQKRAIEKRTADHLARMAQEAGSRDALIRRAEAKGQTIDDLTADVRRRITIATYLAAKVRPGVHVTRRQMVHYYERHRSEFERPERRTWRIIMIRPDKFARPAGGLRRAQAGVSLPNPARARANHLKTRLDEGADFAALAREFSHGLRPDEGGLWGPMARDEFAIREVVDAVFRLAAGAVGPVIETPTALYLVKVETIAPARKASFADVQDEIRKHLTDAELGRRRRAFSRQLQQRAFIRVYYK